MDRPTATIMNQIAEEAAEKAVQKAMLTLGIDATDPLGAQQDMVAVREMREMISDPEFRRDMQHLRRWRRTMDSVEKKGVVAFFSFIVLGGIALLIAGVKMKFGF